MGNTQFSGIRIFTKCLAQILRNWKVLVKLSWFWGVVFVCLVYIQDTFFIYDPEELVGSFVTESFLWGASFVLVATLGGVTIAIGWHRYILLNEEPRPINLLNSGWPNLAYFLMSFQIALIYLIFVVAFVIVGVPIANLILASAPITEATILLSIIYLLAGSFLVCFSLCLSLTLPAIAIGEPIRMSESLALTRNLKFQFLLIAIPLIVIQTLPKHLISSFSGQTDIESPSSLTIAIPIYLIDYFCLIIGIGILTNAYKELCMHTELDTAK